MADVFSKNKRSEIMSKIRSKNTKPEIWVRKWLHAKGLRFRIHASDIPGKPDISIKKYKIAVFVHGCFWHGHGDCKDFRLPKSNINYWKEKIRKNKERDAEKILDLKQHGWFVFVLWECRLKKRFESEMKSLYEEITKITN